MFATNPDPELPYDCPALVVAAWGDEATALNEITKDLKL
jgi:hypothetical protein